MAYYKTLHGVPETQQIDRAGFRTSLRTQILSLRNPLPPPSKVKLPLYRTMNGVESVKISCQRISMQILCVINTNKCWSIYSSILQIACMFPIFPGYREREGQTKEWAGKESDKKKAKMQDGEIAAICNGTYPCRLALRVVLKTTSGWYRRCPK